MEKKIKEVFDAASPEEMDILLQDMPLPTLPAGVNAAKIQKKAMEKAGIAPEKKASIRHWKPIAAMAACFILILGATLGLSQLGQNTGTAPSFSSPREDSAPVHSITDMLGTFDPQNIVWAQTPEDPDVPASSDKDLTVQQWNGLNVTAELLSALSADDGTGLFAVGLVSTPQQGDFQSFIYREMTGQQLLTEQARLAELDRQLLVLSAIEQQQVLEGQLTQLQQQVETKLLDHYRTPTGWDLNAIASDLESTREALKNCTTVLTNARDAYMESRSVPDLSQLAAEGYYVVESKGISYLIVSAQDLIRLSTVWDSLNSQGKFVDTTFRLIRPKQLGLIANNGFLIPGDTPPDDEIDITLPSFPPPDAEISPIRPTGGLETE